jgi:hypothetical protein
MDNVLIEYLFAGLFKLWLKTPRFLKYATFALIAVAAALYGFYRLSIFSAAFIPAIYFARNGDKLAHLSIYALSFLFAILLMTTNGWIFGMGWFIATLTFLLVYWKKITSSWPFAIMFFVLSPLAYYSGHSYWAITHIVFGVSTLIVSSLYRSLATTTKP